jgi:hypothetical protein
MLKLHQYFLSKSHYGWIFGLLFCFSGCAANTDTSTDFSKVVASNRIPILSNEQAMGYAKAKYFSEYKNPVVPEEAAPEGMGGFGSWKIKSQEKLSGQNTYWFVLIYSSGVIPIFSCTASFNRDGQSVNDPSSHCRYNK